jgi:hypothetical protein
LALHFTQTPEEIEFVTQSARSAGSRLSLMVLLKLFQTLHRFPHPDDVPVAVVNHLRIHLRLGETIAFECNDPFQLARQVRTIREYFGVRAWSKQARHTGGQPMRRPWARFAPWLISWAVIEEVRELPVSPDYFAYLRHQLARIGSTR